MLWYIITADICASYRLYHTKLLLWYIITALDVINS